MDPVSVAKALVCLPAAMVWETVRGPSAWQRRLYDLRERLALVPDGETLRMTAPALARLAWEQMPGSGGEAFASYVASSGDGLRPQEARRQVDLELFRVRPFHAMWEESPSATLAALGVNFAATYWCIKKQRFMLGKAPWIVTLQLAYLGFVAGGHAVRRRDGPILWD
jgi:hypothetical protein